MIPHAYVEDTGYSYFLLEVSVLSLRFKTLFGIIAPFSHSEKKVGREGEVGENENTRIRSGCVFLKLSPPYFLRQAFSLNLWPPHSFKKSWN